jgi:sugar lactone lactonase YvrE
MANEWTCAVHETALLGESPMWHPDEQALYYCDIAGHELRCVDPHRGTIERWQFDTDVACCAPVFGGGLLLAMRDGIWHFDPTSGAKRLLAEPPYDIGVERYNDGKCDAAGRFWCGTLHEPRQPLASLYCLESGALTRKVGGATVSNGLGWSPDGRTMYWGDTTAHTLYAFDFDPNSAEMSRRRVFAQFARRDPNAPLDDYGGRPDGVAVDAHGNVWVAMYEGARVVQLAPDGTLRRELKVPMRCPTMPCFGDADLKTLYVTSARHKRPADELAQQPLAGAVVSMRVDVPGLPANFALMS